MATMYGADADELDRLANEFRLIADDIDRDARLLTVAINNVAWLGDVAIRYLGDWSGVSLPRLDLSTRFLRDAADQLANNAAEQRQASGSEIGPGRMPPLPGSRGAAGTPAEQIESSFVRNEANMRDYLERYPDDHPFRVAVEERLAQGFRIHYFDGESGHLVWATGNLASAKNVVFVVPGTGATMQSVTEGLTDVGWQYQNSSGDTAVLTAMTWTPPPGLLDNVALEHYQDTMATGPTADILRSLHATGRSVVVTGHSAGGAAVQTLFERHPDLAGAVDGVVLLAPAEYHPEFPGVMGDTPIVYAVHDDDPIQFAHVDEIGAIISVGSHDNVTLATAASGTSTTGGAVGFIENLVTGDPGQAHDQDVYAKNFADRVTGMFPGTTSLPDGMVRQRIVEADGSVSYVDTATF